MSALVQEFESYLVSSRKTLSYVGRAAGVSGAALSQWRSGKYGADPREIEAKIASFLRREREKDAGQQLRCPFVMTSVAGRMFDTARICHLEQCVGVAVSDAGNGKTEAVHEYCRRNRDTILIEADQGYTAFALFTALHRMLCAHNGKESLHEMVEQVVDKLRDSGRLIIVDEAENLPVKALDLLRRVYDKAGCGVLLTGLPRLEANLRGKRGEFVQLYSRVGVFARLDGISESDAEQLSHTFMPGVNGVWELAYAVARKNARTMILLLKRARTLAKVNKTGITETIIDKAVTTLMM